ncbi:hypothetical protein OPKNFCMD_0141 [Methylobacterium crusticola]|uniref:DUF1508 domain-containing protein n=1 Tax=Methylobacterium crusticola TaxID=1697972 RepID=A0ABQ4QQ60_9HYPH|nr:hypothetical protein [Methylobacterium crusticola]GJD47433.1 hypothetical protein OPKNFCMD_0141 [Methylobacterium crusticola]
MTENSTHPYTIEIAPLERPAGHFQWSIRKNGKLIERSDRPHLTAEKARESALAAVERAFRSASDTRRR